MKVNISAEYYCGTESEVEIPNVENWKDIKEWFVKWGTFHYTTDNKTWKEIDLGDVPTESIDMKRPISVHIRTTDYQDLDSDEE